MIIRRQPSSLQLITQPAHAALAERIMRNWQADHFPESPRRGSILQAVAQHDDGWAEVDDALEVDGATGRLLDFIEVFGGRSIAIEIEAREIGPQRFESAAAARELVRSASIVRLAGTVTGAVT